jgi:hypothetical protein
MGMAAEDEVRTTEVCRQVQPCGLATLGKAKIRFGYIQIWDLAIALTVTVDLTLHRQPGIKELGTLAKSECRGLGPKEASRGSYGSA